MDECQHRLIGIQGSAFVGFLFCDKCGKTENEVNKMETREMTAKPQQRSVSEELTLERQLSEAKRQIAAREATIESQARQLEAQDEQAWDLVRKFTKLLQERE
jgi:uncharacterized Zn finger protein (UPF0148 family)